MFMCTQPSDPGTGASVHESPPSSLHHTLDVSSLPTHFSPGTVTQLKTGSRMRPPAVTTGGWRTKTPPAPVAGSSTVGGSHVSPPSCETRRRTSDVSWLPASCAV